VKIVRSVVELREALGEARLGRIVGFVPTMGFLHEGHLSLIDAARAEGAGLIVVSIFVNPLQFAPNEDFDRYPRDEARDIELLKQREVDVLFLPPVEEIYPEGATTRVTTAGVALPLEGERRPGHFDGVATVVLKLFNMVQPHVAVFGRKDAQQCAVIEQMVRDLDVPVRLAFAETVRESDGLAKSSRNAYLNDEERTSALALQSALRVGEAALRRGNGYSDAESAMEHKLSQSEGVVLDYLRVVDPRTFLTPVDHASDEVLLVGAVKVGRTRLIDNIRLQRSEIGGGA
jgi:pantoate--beta-alanine ligase